MEAVEKTSGELVSSNQYAIRAGRDESIAYLGKAVNELTETVSQLKQAYEANSKSVTDRLEMIERKIDVISEDQKRLLGAFSLTPRNAFETSDFVFQTSPLTSTASAGVMLYDSISMDVEVEQSEDQDESKKDDEGYLQEGSSKSSSHEIEPIESAEIEVTTYSESSPDAAQPVRQELEVSQYATEQSIHQPMQAQASTKPSWQYTARTFKVLFDAAKEAGFDRNIIAAGYDLSDNATDSGFEITFSEKDKIYLDSTGKNAGQIHKEILEALISEGVNVKHKEVERAYNYASKFEEYLKKLGEEVLGEEVLDLFIMPHDQAIKKIRDLKQMYLSKDKKDALEWVLALMLELAEDQETELAINPKFYALKTLWLDFSILYNLSIQGKLEKYYCSDRSDLFDWRKIKKSDIESLKRTAHYVGLSKSNESYNQPVKRKKVRINPADH